MQKLPSWFRKKIPANTNYSFVKDTLAELNLNTVCKEAKCPNVGDCYSCGRATFMILGDVCTRNCRFCGVNNVGTGLKPVPTDIAEPQRIREAVFRLKLKYVVITSVTRDDLDDGGAGLFAEVVRQIKSLNNETKVEVLVPDFQGDERAIKIVIDSKPDVFNHNLETIPRLYDIARRQADFEQSLSVLETARSFDKTIITKSGMMLGLGEKKEEVIEVLRKLRDVDCDIVTLGQYLKPLPNALDVDRYVTPEEFAEYENIGLELGFKRVFSGPLVRSSYNAEEIYSNCRDGLNPSRNGDRW